MSDLAQRIDTTEIANLRVSQLDGAPRLQALIREVLGVVDDALTQPLARLETYLRIETAEGVWLDYIGERLGLFRPLDRGRLIHAVWLRRRRRRGI